jgi:thiol:disulfide interchange protein DsbD
MVCVLVTAALGAASAGATDKVELARSEDEYSSVHVEPARMGTKPGLAVMFEGTEDLHYYAKPETAPSEFELKITAKSERLDFEDAVFPKWSIFRDPLERDVEVYVGDFTVFVPIKMPTPTIGKYDVEVKISGIACTSMVCLPPFEKTLSITIGLGRADSWRQITLETGAEDKGAALTGPSYPIWFAFGLAFLAGLSLNIMPCVWPVLPIIVMRIVEQGRQGKGVPQTRKSAFGGPRGRSLAMGLVFCLGILSFFAVLAAANIVLRLAYGTALQWGDPFRNPIVVLGMSLLLIVLALFMFGVFTITIPSSIAGKSGSGKGYAGAAAMGFLAAILSTPCSFGILAAAFAWAQVQRLPLATLTMLIIGVGMAVPYAILTSMPRLLGKLPRAGRWMDLFKQTVGFILLIIAAKLVMALPEARRAGVLYFSIVLAFSVWVWSTWVGYGTKPVRKWLVRTLAAVLAIGAGWFFLPASGSELIDWQDYDAEAIEAALERETPVLIKFTAGWCTSCEVVERIVYARKSIAKLIQAKGVLAVKADTTETHYPATIALKNVYKEPGVPVSLLFVPGAEEPVRWRSFGFADELQKALEQIPTDN